MGMPLMIACDRPRVGPKVPVTSNRKTLKIEGMVEGDLAFLRQISDMKPTESLALEGQSTMDLYLAGVDYVQVDLVRSKRPVTIWLEDQEDGRTNP